MIETKLSAELPSEQIEKVAVHLRGKLRGRVARLSLLKRDDWLVLRGTSHTYYAKQLAQHALMASCCHTLIANEIEVVPLPSLS